MDMRLQAFVSGRVQGVGYRFFVYEHASSLGLTGWVRNLKDGNVEVVAEGSTEALETLLAELERGPGGSRVSEVKTNWSAASAEFYLFSIEHC
ncbi:MAG TPA: acylphosphatase [Anaerolineaceae bacterium]|nr:acylphosphatase [Anaerolineaceae bacterium]